MSKREKLKAAGYEPKRLTAYERVKFASVAASDNGKSREARRVG